MSSPTPARSSPLLPARRARELRNPLGHRLESRSKRTRKLRLMSYWNLPTSWTMKNIWRTTKSDRLSLSLRTVSMRLHKTPTGRKISPLSGTKPTKRRLRLDVNVRQLVQTILRLKVR